MLQLCGACPDLRYRVVFERVRGACCCWVLWRPGGRAAATQGDREGLRGAEASFLVRGFVPGQGGFILSEKRKLILRKQTPAYTQAEHTQRTAKA